MVDVKEKEASIAELKKSYIRFRAMNEKEPSEQGSRERHPGNLPQEVKRFETKRQH